MKKEVLAVLFIGLTVVAAGCTEQQDNGPDDQPETEGENPLAETEDDNETQNNTTEDDNDSPEGISGSSGGSSGLPI